MFLKMWKSLEANNSKTKQNWNKGQRKENTVKIEIWQQLTTIKLWLKYKFYDHDNFFCGTP